MLKEVELRILRDIYEMNLNRGKTISYKKYELNTDSNGLKRNAFGECLLKLEKLGYIHMDKDAIICDRVNNTRYGINVVGFLYKKIHITQEGISLIEGSFEECKEKN